MRPPSWPALSGTTNPRVHLRQPRAYGRRTLLTLPSLAAAGVGVGVAMNTDTRAGAEGTPYVVPTPRKPYMYTSRADTIFDYRTGRGRFLLGGKGTGPLSG